MTKKHAWILLLALLVSTCAAAQSAPRPVIVLGNYPVDASAPADPQTARCLKAYELFSEGKGDVIVVSGGHTRGHISEARMMKIALVAYGVPESSIVEEDRSGTTVENSIFAKKIFEEKGWRKKAILVSQSYHLPRAKAVFQSDGFEIKNVVASVSSKASDFENMPYEKIEAPKGFEGGTLIVFEPYESEEPMNYPTPALSRRLRAAAGLYRSGAAKKVIVMSDWHTRGPVDISEMMRVALVSLGVQPADVILKNNVHYSKVETIKQVIPENVSSLIITSPKIKDIVERDLPGAQAVYME